MAADSSSARAGRFAAAERLSARALGFAALAWLAALSTAGCLDRRDDAQPQPVGACTRCHGSASRVVDAPGLSDEQRETLRAAPPIDLAGNTDPSYPGVGAHQLHLTASPTHGPVACGECHKVPSYVEEPGHMDAPPPARITFGPLARHAAHTPAFDATALTCTGTYCHRDATPVWTAARTSEQACGTCHGLPPSAPHPQSQDCFRCHGDVIDAERHFKAPERHLNGTADVVAMTCHGCHGSEKSNAPPRDLDGGTDPASPGVGAHDTHLDGGHFSRPVACEECHQVPKTVDAPGHIDPTTGAELTFSGVATTEHATPSLDPGTLKCSGSWCHGPVDPAKGLSPAWNQPSATLECNACHGYPPAAPHPPMARCSICHSQVVGPDNKTVIDRTLHVNGVIDLALPTQCNACHGSATNDAPPGDIDGGTATTSASVGAHQKHLTTTIARAVKCDECHVVPAKVDQPGHFDFAGPVQPHFSGVATAWGSTPTFDGQACANVYCHGAKLPGGAPSGGQHTSPVWTQVDGTQTQCNGCHGLPPPAPHPADDQCSKCHSNVDANRQVIDPALHVNGRVEL